MKKILFAICSAMLAFCACQDIEELTGRVDDLENRVTYLEELCKDINSNVALIQAFVTAHENDLYIKNVTEVSDGFTVTFTNGLTYTLKNGEKGNKGDKGPQGDQGIQGPKGEDAVAPVVSVKLDTDGGYYWTLNGEWLMVDGKKVSALGVTPQLKIQDGKWMICYGGDKWEEVGPAYDYSTAITITEDETAVYLTLHDGTQFVIEKVPGFSFKVESTDVAVSAGKNAELKYTLSDGDESVRFEVRGTFAAEVVPTDVNSGVIKVTVPETIEKGYVLVTAVKNSTSEFKAQYIEIEEGVLTLSTDTYTIPEFGEVINVPVRTNLEYEVTIPADAAWVTLVETKAVRDEVVSLVVAANEGETERSATVTIAAKDGSVSKTVAIVQSKATGMAPYFRVNTADINVESTATTAVVKVEANVPWTITVPEGVTATPAIGSGDTDVTITFASNEGIYTATTVPVTVAATYAALETKSYTVNIVKAATKNPNDFTYVRWGNNIGENGAALTPLAEYGNQFRITKADGTLEINVVESDIPEGATVKYAYTKKTQVSASPDGVAINAATGKITITYKGEHAHSDGKMYPRTHYGIITVTVGTGETAVVRKFPLFVDQTGYRNGWDVRFTPFAPRFNPVTGGVVTPTVTYVKQDGGATEGFTCDYRRNANWYNLNSTFAEGAPNKSDYVAAIWNAYFSAFGKANNTAAISPISWYGDSNGAKGNTDKCAMFVTPETFAITVNPGKFVYNDVPGDGVLVGTMHCNVNNIDPVNKAGVEVFPLIIWLDPTK